MALPGSSLCIREDPKKNTAKIIYRNYSGKNASTGTILVGKSDDERKIAADKTTSANMIPRSGNAPDNYVFAEDDKDRNDNEYFNAKRHYK